MSTCYFCLAQLTGHHMVDCPGLMPPASHVPPMALPGVEDADDDDTPADAHKPVMLPVQAQVQARDDGYYMVDMYGQAWKWGDETGWVCVGMDTDDVTGTD